jgi:hypothetical protein
VVAVTGDGAAQVVAGLGGLHNVLPVVRGDRSAAEVEAAVAATSATYVVHDVDPLAEVGDAWVGYFDGSAPTGRLEVAISAAVDALSRDRLALPDYYVVLRPEELPMTRRHWWLGALAGLAPSRVLPLPAPATASMLARDLANLPSGRWWPDDLADRLRALPRTVPDQAGLTTPATTQA